MSIIAYPHPEWCDPRLCTTRPDGTEHRAAPVAASWCDHQVSVGRVRHDPLLAGGESLVGADEVHIHAENEAALSPAGDRLAVDLYLSPTETRDLRDTLTHVMDGISASYLARRD